MYLTSMGMAMSWGSLRLECYEDHTLALGLSHDSRCATPFSASEAYLGWDPLQVVCWSILMAKCLGTRRKLKYPPIGLRLRSVLDY